MFAAGIVDLFVRMVTSLAVVLGIVAIAYVVMRRRAGMTVRPSAPSGRRSTRLATASVNRVARAAGASTRRARPGRRGHRAAIEVLGRTGLSRSSAAVVLRFGDRVLLVGASEQGQPTVLAEIDAATWELCQADTEWAVPTEIDDLRGAPRDEAAPELVPARPGFLDALREATVRRA